MSTPRKVTPLHRQATAKPQAQAAATTANDAAALVALREGIHQDNQHLAQQLGALGIPVNHGSINTAALTGVVEMAALVQILTVDLKLFSAELFDLRAQEALHDILTRALAEANKPKSGLLLPGAPKVPGDLKVN
ncbi:MAG TPA: hypothetical protein VGR57_12910 [Ktedonobacterales bacterium]|nr:hypothetical protein [Ktedonobacterales bacterium]